MITNEENTKLGLTVDEAREMLGIGRNLMLQLEPMTPYGLIHSFATFCSEQGMEEIVLMRLMGHSNFDTTQKYYICVSSKRKKQAIQEVYKLD